MSMEIKIGSEVKFLNDVGGGIVLEIFSDGTASVQGEDGFDMKYNLTELMLVSDSITEQEEEYNNKLPDLAKIIAQDVNEERQKLIQKDFEIKYANVRATNQQRRGEHMVIDLHIHELIDQSGLQDRTKLDIQLNHFERMMRIAGEQRVKRVIFIHGVGQGVLRNQIRTRLDSYYPDCTVRDGNPREYGAGATEVILGQSSF